MRAVGAEVLRVPAQSDGRLDLEVLVSRLSEMGVASVMVEGGASIISFRSWRRGSLTRSCSRSLLGSSAACLRSLVRTPGAVRYAPPPQRPGSVLARDLVVCGDLRAARLNGGGGDPGEPGRLILALWDASQGVVDPLLKDRLRDLALSWSRFGYDGDVIEATDARPLLERGPSTSVTTIASFWAMGRSSTKTGTLTTGTGAMFHRAFADLMADGDFLAAGQPLLVVDGPVELD